MLKVSRACALNISLDHSVWGIGQYCMRSFKEKDYIFLSWFIVCPISCEYFKCLFSHSYRHT